MESEAVSKDAKAFPIVTKLDWSYSHATSPENSLLVDSINKNSPQ